MECLVKRLMVMILREFGVNPLRIKMISVKVMEMDVVLEQDELTLSIVLDFRARLDGGRIVEVLKLTTDRLVNGLSCDGIDMVLKNLDFEPKVDAIMRDFLEYKELNTKQKRPRGTTQVVTRGTTNDWYEVAGQNFLRIKHAQSEEVQELLNKLLQDLRSINEELAEYINTPNWNLPTSSYDDDDDEESSIPLKDIIIFGLPPCVAITPALSPEEPVDSLIMKDEHLDTIPEKESDEFIKSSVENLVQNPIESEDVSDGECDVPVDDETSPTFTTLSNPLFDSNDNFTSSDDELLSDEDVPMENFKIYSNPLFDDEEIISPKIDLHYFNAESNLIESLLNRDILIDSSPIRGYSILKKLLNDKVPLHPPENESSNLDHFNDPSHSRPPPERPDVEICFDFEPDMGVVTTNVVKGISEHYVLMPNILPTLPTFDLDLDFTPSHDSLGFRNTIFDPGIFIEIQSERLLSWDEFSISFIRDHLSLLFDTIVPFSSENKDKVFNPGILISPLLSHRGEIFSNFSKSLMMISGGDIPHLDVPFLHFYPP
ncbi:hypothetical protein Tco_0840247 [Tanacetum coccineum]|uniref:Reverse transcriptase domain-containing protein n=1 Tax=Tanacetum coccineum TaxID=301880 RepID=A0ABQ5ASZ7_9ASTR